MKVIKRPACNNDEFMYTDQINYVDVHGPYYFYKVGSGHNRAIAILTQQCGFRYWNQLINHTTGLKFQGNSPSEAIEKALNAGRIIYRAETFKELCEAFLSREPV